MLVSPRSNDELLVVSLEGRTDFAVDLVELSLEQSEVLVVYRYLIFGHCDMIERISSTCVKVESRSGKRLQNFGGLGRASSTHTSVRVQRAGPVVLFSWGLSDDQNVAFEEGRLDLSCITQLT